VKAIVCPLDWGLGHATRCVPLIRELQEQDFEVEIGCCDTQKAFFQLELPGIILHDAPSYRIRYPEFGWQMPFWLLAELPRLQKLIHEEQRWIESLAAQRKATHIISDNRFGCFSRNQPSIYITHQLRIALPSPFEFLEFIGERWHASHQAHFREVWIPDYPEFPGLAGKLSHQALHGAPTRFLGPLSRFSKDAGHLDVTDPIDFLALLSGPEPMRTRFESLLCRALTDIPGEHVIVRGLPGAPPPVQTPGIRIYNHLPSSTLQSMIMNSRNIVCRPGYSTVMDLACLGAHAILVPTPGQTEQIYLGKKLSQSGKAGYIAQNMLSARTLSHASQLDFNLPFHKNNKKQLEQAVQHLKQLN